MALYHMVYNHLAWQFVDDETDVQSFERLLCPKRLCHACVTLRFDSWQNPRNELQTFVELWLLALLSISPALAHGLHSKRWLCKTIIMYFHIWAIATCAPSHAFINGELSGVGCSAYSHIKQAGGEMPSLLPFDINQLRASLHLLLHLFSSALLCMSPLSSLSISICLIDNIPATVSTCTYDT